MKLENFKNRRSRLSRTQVKINVRPSGLLGNKPLLFWRSNGQEAQVLSDEERILQLTREVEMLKIQIQEIEITRIDESTENLKAMTWCSICHKPIRLGSGYSHCSFVYHKMNAARLGIELGKDL